MYALTQFELDLKEHLKELDRWDYHADRRAWLAVNKRAHERADLNRIKRTYTHTRSALIWALREMPGFIHLRGRFFECLAHVESEEKERRRWHESSLLKETTWEYLIDSIDENGWEVERFYSEVYNFDLIASFIAIDFGHRCRLCGELKYNDINVVRHPDTAICYDCNKRYSRWYCHPIRDTKRENDDPLLFEEWLTRCLKMEAKEARRKEHNKEV